MHSRFAITKHRFNATVLPLSLSFISLIAGTGTCCAQDPSPGASEPSQPSWLGVRQSQFSMGHAIRLWDESEENQDATVAVDQRPNQEARTATQNESSAWWTESTAAPSRQDATSLKIDLDSLFAMTVAHSGRIQAIQQTPWISQSEVDQARAVYDPALYNETRFDSTSDPVGNSLTTGGPPRLEDNTFYTETGLRGSKLDGSSYHVGQRLGYKNSNSNFFLPNDQGNARLFANWTKPLMRGRAIDANRTLILTGQFETTVARVAFQETIQQQLFQVADTYWSLYTERASRLQRQQHLERASQLSELLENRGFHDGTQSQILRARTAVTNRRAELVQVESRIRNLESVLRSLVNAPELIRDRNAEFLPVQHPSLLALSFDIETEVGISMQQRPELRELKTKRRILAARLNLSCDQTQPQLDLVAEGYLAGLEGESNIPRAFEEQFTAGRPGFAFGLNYELPIGRQAALAAVRQQRLELAQLNHFLRETTETIRAEVEKAVRNVAATEQAVIGRQASLAAAMAEVEYLQDRWMTLGNDPRLGQLQLSELLSSHDRLLQEEQDLLNALVQYNRAVLEVQRATGRLTQFPDHSLPQR